MIYPCQRAQVQFQFTQEIGQHGRNSRVNRPEIVGE